MSQVIVTKDSLLKKRQASLAKEAKIVKCSSINRWKRLDLPTSKIEAGIGLLLVPIFGAWGVLVAFMSLSFAFVLLILKTLGGILKVFR